MTPIDYLARKRKDILGSAMMLRIYLSFLQLEAIASFLEMEIRLPLF
jgi:hypothetical protein